MGLQRKIRLCLIEAALSFESPTQNGVTNEIIESLLISIFHQTWNLRYTRHNMIISHVGLESFLLAINFVAMSSSNVFSS